jgi:hypothetical protein
MSNVAYKGFIGRHVPTYAKNESSIDKFFARPKLQQVKQGFADENSVALSYSTFIERNQTFKEDTEYSPFYDPELEPYINNIDYFKSSKSKEETRYMIKQLKEDNQLISQNPGAYFLGRLTGAILDPISMIAFGAKAFRTTTGALNVKKVTGIITAEELYKQAIDSNRETELGYLVPFGTAVTTGLLSGITKLRNKEGGETISKYNRSMDRLDRKETEVASVKITDSDDIDTRIIDPNKKMNPQSAGASAGGQAQGRSYNDDLFDEEFINTLTGLENTPLTPVFRLIKSPVLTMRELVTDMLDTKLIQKKNLKGIETTQSIESKIARKYLYVVNNTRVVQNLYKDYLKRVYTEKKLGEPNFVNRTINSFKSNDIMSEQAFRKEVTKALTRENFGANELAPEIVQAARKVREDFFTLIGREADAEELFSLYSKTIIAGLKKTRDRMKSSGEKTTTQKGKKYSLEQIEKRIADEEGRFETINKTGPLRNNYLPRYWRKDNIRKNKEKFKEDLKESFHIKGIQVSSDELDDIIDDILSSIPFNKLPKNAIGKDDTFDLEFAFQASGISKHLRNRVWNFDDETLIRKGYLEDDINVIMKQYFNSIVPDIEIAKVFGDVSMMGIRGPGYRPGIAEARIEWDNYINVKAPKATRPKLREKLIAQRDSELRDLEAMRDLLRGTYGLPADPSGAFPAGVRTLKNLNNMIFLSGFLSAAPDMARLIMQNGLKNGFGQIFEVFTNQTSFKLLKLAKKEAEMVGEALDLVFASRASILGNVDDMVFGFNKIERATSGLNSVYFTYINMMNVWNTGVKSMASFIGGSKIIELSENFMKGSISKKDMAKLASAGINRDMAKRIFNQYEKFGLGPKGKEGGNFKYTRIARSDNWDDRGAAEVFGNALRKEIRITIVTPDKGDVPLWMNDATLSLLAQFKKFGMGATQAILMRGLQERDQNFFTGVLFLVGMGAMVDMIRTSAFDRDYSKKKLGDKIASAIDRSAVIGIFSDVNRMIEVASNNDLGIAPALGAGKPYDSTFKQKIGLAGPTGSLLGNLHEIMIDTGSGNYDYTTARAIRRSLPLQNIWYLDSIFDRLEKGMR